jgi:protein-disulfide isomerase
MRPLALALILLAGCGGAPARPPLPAGACRAADDDARPWELRGHRVAVPAVFAPRRGAERPRVVIQAFSDFECPFCARAEPTMTRILETYGDCVQVVWRNRPLPYHEHAALAARAALEVYRQLGDDGFWRYHDALFADQAHLTQADLEQKAEALSGIDMEAFRAALGSDAHQPVLDRDAATIDAIEPRLGTPTFIVNGELIHGARPYERFAQSVEDALRAQ